MPFEISFHALLAAAGCPRCAAGEAAWQEFLARDPFGNLLSALLPFLVVALISAGAERFVRPGRGRG